MECDWCGQKFEDGEYFYIIKSACYNKVDDDYESDPRNFQKFHPDCLTESRRD